MADEGRFRMVTIGQAAGELHLRGVKGAGELRLKPGTITVLLGPNGAGKTRLLETAAGLVESGGIRVSYGQEPIRITPRPGFRGSRLNAAALLSYGYACQSPEEQLFCRSVEEELRYVLKPFRLNEPERERRIEAALAAVGWDSGWLQRDPYLMSGGERRRAALACLFAVPAAWLLLDEPTSGLDAAGCAIVGRQLEACAAAGQGVLLVSHESDWALALADVVLLMSPEGGIRRCGRNDLLAHPERFGQCGMSVPVWLQAARSFWLAGVPADCVWQPDDLASAAPTLGQASASAGEGFGRTEERPVLAGAVPVPDAEPARRTGTGSERAGAVSVPDAEPARRAGTGPERTGTPAAAEEARPRTAADAYLPDEAASAGSAAPSAAGHRAAASPSPLAAYDPRSVWLAYLLVSAAVLSQRTWLGIAVSALAVTAIAAAFRIPLRRWRGAITALAIFTLMLSLFAGIEIGRGGLMFAVEPFLASLNSLIRPWLAMLLGLGLPLAVTPLRLRRSLERLFAPRGRVPLWAQRLILAVTLLLRFIPVLLSEWERFARIAAARGKDPRRSWRGAAGRLRDIATPFLLALFRLGEQAALALESRGVGRRPYPLVSRSRLWRPRDSALAAGSAAAAFLLWLLGRL
ncbi:ATP-binding cassette domain-containing protein [Paenibacillus humicola]|uniref:ATP-binding cassette domain-containing protein n=1 Tax=Paenibacillus humicola TaxID=3110540 RepID=UPI00237A2099|nr:ATP-binding cassette domain-containing protein [Paenibacillus humicola]